MFCKYKDIFGKPGEGLHSYRLFDIAIVDVAMTGLAAFIICKLFKISFIKTLIVLFLLGIVMDNLFCVNTKVSRFISNKIDSIQSYL